MKKLCNFKIKKCSRKRKGKRYLLYYKYVPASTKEINKRLFGGVLEKESNKYRDIPIVPKSILIEIINNIAPISTIEHIGKMASKMPKSILNKKIPF